MMKKTGAMLFLLVIIAISLLSACMPAATAIQTTATATTQSVEHLAEASAQLAEAPQPAEASAGEVANLVYPGVYSEAEQKMLDEVRQQLDRSVGWQGSGNTSMDVPMTMTADKYFMELWANAVDYWNLLFNNEEYANKTKYGGLIAAPFFKEAGAMFPTLPMNPELGSWSGTNDGGGIEFFLPIRPGDTFKTYTKRSAIEDITPSEGSTTRTFAVTGSGTLYNQNGEKVLTSTMYGRNMYSHVSSSNASAPGVSPSGGPSGAPTSGGPGGTPPIGGAGGNASMARHKYTEADWAFIHEIEDAEVVRGNNTLYWEDVDVGDEPPWTIVGPTTTLDMIQFAGLGIIQSPPMREQLKNASQLNGLKQDEYGVYHLMVEGHFSEAGMGGNMPIHYMAFGRSLMARLITNWIGDDGWLSKFSWRNGNLANDIIAQVPSLHGKTVTGHGKVSDVLIAKAYVTKMYVENDEHRIDLVVWTEDIVGTLCQAANATVILPSKSSN